MSWKGILARASLLAVLSGAVAGCSYFPEQPEHATTARINQIVAGQTKERLDAVIIVAQSPSGRIGRAAVKIAQLSCKVGDTIKATEIGISLSLNLGSCIKGGLNPWAKS